MGNDDRHATSGSARDRRHRRRTLAGALLGSAAATFALAQPTSPHPYADLSLEELANVVITSVARRPQALAGAAASMAGRPCRAAAWPGA